ncbi:hypothetical protein CAPTEDRAFT_223404 [Capitella teleta]|uniref:Uncharacterized protein n=1 Tax=Capitella teleta TaxID=283909 RepID=R7TCU1_CAPTE|nr:hypothetical protein CAPTEDRAFT_223404 [Capitella teleta]|eukprot:ELT91549.1 hypothetical protein CAPTEDRAFT_223404 [Capitella teleta]
MGPVMYIGRETSFKGKRLFDILCRLKNFGVGRIVYRNTFHERYPEPSYYVVKKVFPNMNDPIGDVAYTDIYVFPSGEGTGDLVGIPLNELSLQHGLEAGITGQIKRLQLPSAVWRHVHQANVVLTKKAHNVLHMDKQLTKGTLVAQAIFRGEDKGERVVRAGFKNDWRLVPRHEEEEFLSREHKPLPVNIVPKQCEFPPLFEHFLLKDMQYHKMDTSVKPMLPLIVKQGIDNRAIYESEIESLEEQLGA